MTTSPVFKKLLTAKNTDDILASVAKCIWTSDKKDGNPPIPTLTQIQEFTHVIDDETNTIVFAQEEKYVVYTPEVDKILQKLNKAISMSYPKTDESSIRYTSERDIESEADPSLFDDLPRQDEEEIDIESLSGEILNTMTKAMNARYDAYDDLQRASRIQSSESFSAVSNYILRTAGEPTELRLEWLHQAWINARKHDEQLSHPLASIVKVWIQMQTAKHISAEYDSKRPVSIASYPMGSIREVSHVTGDMARLREFATPDSIQQAEKAQMQLFEDTPSILPPVTPLEIITPDEIPATTKSGAVSHTIRVFFEALMALEPSETQADIMFTLGDLINFLYPDGKFHRPTQLHYILDALKHLHYYATVPFDQGNGRIGYWRPVVVRTPYQARLQMMTKYSLMSNYHQMLNKACSLRKISSG